MTSVTRRFDVRVELPLNDFKDFTVTAYDIDMARKHARKRIESEIDNVRSIEWRGLVAFVNREP